VSIDLKEARCDEEAARLLPWYVSGRLSAADVERVSSHLERCTICRNDVTHESAIRALLKAEARVEYAPQAGLAKTLSRIDELGRDAPTASASSRILAISARRRVGALQWLTAAVLVQAVALGWLGIARLHPAPPGAPGSQYETLSVDPQYTATGPHIRVVFAPTMTLVDLKALLAPNHLLIVRGPTDAGAYTLASTDPHVTAAQLAPTVAILRSDPRVLFAEPAVNDAPAMP
jgi:putative zinc finger protein